MSEPSSRLAGSSCAGFSVSASCAKSSAARSPSAASRALTALLIQIREQPRERRVEIRDGGHWICSSAKPRYLAKPVGL
jgi:hypothetical protein